MHNRHFSKAFNYLFEAACERFSDIKVACVSENRNTPTRQRETEQERERERERIFLQFRRFVSNIKKMELLTMNNHSGELNIELKLLSTFKSLCLTVSHGISPMEKHIKG